MAENKINSAPELSAATLKADLELITSAAKKAGEIALSFFNSANEVWQKSGNSPVSEADYAADKYLRETLLKARPEYGWLSEETEDNEKRLNKSTLFVVDPIDGTRGFLAGKKQWCVSVGIVHNKQPVAGVLECPALSETYTAAHGLGSKLNGDEILLGSDTTVSTITGSRKLNADLKQLDGHDLLVLEFVPSLAYRLAMVATGDVDAGIARPGANDWDLAAADIILKEAGGSLTDENGVKCEYNREQTRVGSRIAAGKNKHKEILRLAKSLGFLH